MNTNELIPFKESGHRVTCTASAAVTGKTAVAISGDVNADGTYTVAPAGAVALVFGVACWDAAIGERVTVITVPSGMVVPVTVGEDVSAGESVETEAGGTAIVAAATERAFGIVITGALADADAMIQLAHHTA